MFKKYIYNTSSFKLLTSEMKTATTISSCFYKTSQNIFLYLGTFCENSI